MCHLKGGDLLGEDGLEHLDDVVNLATKITRQSASCNVEESSPTVPGALECISPIHAKWLYWGLDRYKNHFEHIARK